MKDPFIVKSKNGFLIRLCKDLYTMSAINKVKIDNPGTILSVNIKAGNYFLELAVDDHQECFDFLNCLIYHNRAV